MSTQAEDILFSQLGLAAPVLQAVEAVGYEKPSPIQAEAIPPLLEGRDLLGQAQTGTGKTAAFALPLLSRLDMKLAKPQLLVLTPTRELALQVAEALQSYAKFMTGFHVLPVYGGQGMTQQLRQLSRGVQVVVGTPGRIQDHLRRGSLKLNDLKALVLDEADEMLRMGFIDDVENILASTPEQRQVALFSATMPPAIKRVASKYLNNPVEIKIKTKTSTVTAIRQRYWQVSGVHKLDALTRMLEVEEFDAMIIFVRTKTATVELAQKLEARGYASAALNGDLNQAMREQTVDRLKRGHLDIIVATDVAARGLDVERMSHVVNYDIPHDTEAYVHRIGRTGRAGRKGDAILFVAPRERRMLFSIEKATGQKIEQMQLPDREQISNHRVTQFKTQLTEAMESQELAFFEEMIEGYQSEHNVGLAEVAAGLAYLLQKDRPLVPEFKDVKPGRVDDRDDRPRRRESGREQGRDRGGRDQGPMESYRLEVGRDHGVQPKNIVGAIANEAGIESRFIGGIKIHDDYSTVDLPANLPSEVVAKLQKTWVCGQALRPSRMNQGGGQPFRGKPKKFDGKKAGPRKPSDKKFADKGKPKLKIKPKEKKD